jgi:hypothetical protein
LLRREDLHLLKSHTISAARRVGGVIGMEIAVGEVGGIAEPHSAAIGLDELRGNVHEIALLAKVLDVGDEFPRSGDLVRLEDVSVEAGDGGSSVGDSHEIFPERRNVSGSYVTAVIVPIDQRPHALEVCPTTRVRPVWR